MVCLVISVIERTTLKANNSSEPVHVVDGSSGSDLGSETVSTNSGKSDLVRVHKSDDIVRDLLHVVRVVVVRVSLVTVVEEPNVSDFSNFVVLSIEEGLEVLSRLDQLGKPNQSGEILLLSLQVLASELHTGGVSDLGSLYS